MYKNTSNIVYYIVFPHGGTYVWLDLGGNLELEANIELVARGDDDLLRNILSGAARHRGLLLGGDYTARDLRSEDKLELDLKDVIRREEPAAVTRGIGIDLEETRDLETRGIEETGGVRGEEVTEHLVNGARTGVVGINARLDGGTNIGVGHHVQGIRGVVHLVGRVLGREAIDLEKDIVHDKVIHVATYVGSVREGASGERKTRRDGVQVRVGRAQGGLKSRLEVGRDDAAYGAVRARRTSPLARRVHISGGNGNLNAVTFGLGVSEVDLISRKINGYDRGILEHRGIGARHLRLYPDGTKKVWRRRFYGWLDSAGGLWGKKLVYLPDSKSRFS